MLSLAIFYPSSPSLLGMLNDLGDPTFFFVAIRFLFRLSLISRAETTLLIPLGAILDYPWMFCWHFYRKLSSIST